MENVKKFHAKPIQPGQQIQVDVKDAKPRLCDCGCEYFVPVIKVYTLSALMSPTGQELIVQQPVLVCKGCDKTLQAEAKEG